MRYLLLALVVGATVVGAGWVALDKPVDDGWRLELLDLPFENMEVEDENEPDLLAVSKKKRKRKRRGRTHRTGSTGAPDPTPDRSTASPTPRPAPLPPATPPPPNPSSPAETHYQTGLTYLQQKRIPAAITELKKCIALNPRHALAYRALGMAHSVLGKQSSAVEAFEKFVKLAPGHKDAPKVRAIIKAHHEGK